MRGAEILRRRLRAARRQMSSTETVWERALPSEVAFWERWITTGGLSAPAEFQGRLNPRSPILDPFLLRAIRAIATDPVQILDVGAGPLTSMGYVDPEFPERVLEITAVDPLADAYNRLLDGAGVTPPVRTTRCRGEDVAQALGAERFDIAYARNSLDHGVSPVTSVDAMVAAVRPGGCVILIHGRREGEARGYEGLHQWNFDVDDGRLVLFGRGERHDLAERLGLRIETETFSAAPGEEWIAATLHVA